MRIVLLFLFLLASMFVNSQSSALPLNFGSYAIKLGVAKDETLVMTTRIGEVGLAGSIKEDWRRRDVKADKSSLSILLDQPNFFNKDTGFVSGFINSENGKYNIIYHTTNGGLSWKAVKFGQDGWVDDAVNLDNGEAWLSVAGSGIAYTSDYGFTWSKLKNPEIKHRFSNIYFNTERQGIVGSLWNMLAYTNDNCQNWILLPTPLDQKKYNKTNKESRPGFNRVAIYKNYLLVNQENLVFYSKRDSINWTWLPDYNDFYTDASNSALFFKTKKGNYIRSDDNFQPVLSFEIQTNSYDAKCKSGSLYIVGHDKMIQLNNANQVISTPYAAKNSARIDPVYIGNTNKATIGLKDNKIFKQEGFFSGEWKYVFALPYPVVDGKLSITEEGLLLFDRHGDSLFYFNMEGERVRSGSKTSMIEKFSKSSIVKIVFSQGSRGCFHYYNSELIYNNINGNFGEALEISEQKGRSMPVNEDIIEGGEVMALMEKLPLLFDTSQKPTIADLGFTATEYERCRKDILAFKGSLEKSKKNKETSFVFYRNNLDFDRLLSMVDSVKNIDPHMLELSLMNLGNIWSTTSVWKTVQFINSENQILSVSSNYYEPNAFYFPWIISLNGHRIATTNIEINRFIERVYPAFIKGGDRVSVLHELVKDLY